MRKVSRKEFSDAIRDLPTKVRTEEVAQGVIEYRTFSKGEPDRLLGILVNMHGVTLRYLATAAEPH
jgi:hypothetical protein